MNAMTAIAIPAIAAPTRAYRRDRRTQVQATRIERRRDRNEQQASAALAAQLRTVREHSYLASPSSLFRVR